MITIDDSINYIKDNFSRKRALFTGLMLLILISATVDRLFSLFISNNLYRGYIYASACAAWLVCWLVKRNSLPKSKKGYIGIVICIETENDKQKVRLRNDFVKRLKELISQKNLRNRIQIILLNNYQAENTIKVLDEFVKNKGLQEAKQEWVKIQSKTGGKFFIFGSIKERKDNENMYFLELDAIAVHALVEKVTSEQIAKDFANVWYRQISFQEKIEFKGFNFVADTIFIAVQYIVGIAAFVSGDMVLAYELHIGLNNDPYFTKFNKLPPNLLAVKSKLKVLLSEENFQISRRYLLQGDSNKAEEYLDRSLGIMVNYGALLMKSIIAFSYRNNHKEALDWVNRAQSIAGKDGTWRYNKGFLLMHTEDFVNALNVYKEIVNESYEGEELLLESIYEFNQNFLIKHPDKIQSYFIMGFLKYKKEYNPPAALEYFEEFISKSKNISKYRFLYNKALDFQARILKSIHL